MSRPTRNVERESARPAHPPWTKIRRILEAALEEDLGESGDLTTDAVIPAGTETDAKIVARQELVAAGLPVALQVFRLLAERDRRRLAVEERILEGETAGRGAILATVRGDAAVILYGERTALNLLGRMCGVATLTRKAAEEIRGTDARILDTRKTMPCLRILDKYAVAVGGGVNHRFGLYDAVMIKDTHIGVTGSLRAAVRAALDAGHDRSIVTAEVQDPKQLEEVIAAGAGRAILDNMTLPQLRECVEIGKGRIVLEASGGLCPGSLRPVAETGVDFLSLGALTHSAPSADVAMEISPGGE